MTHSFRELTAPELLTYFVKITGGYINKGRDARALSLYMQTQGASATMILYAMYTLNEASATKDIPTLLRLMQSDDLPDVLESEVLLTVALTGQPMPPMAIAYFDLLDTGVADARLENYFQQAKQAVQEYVDDVLAQPASLRAVRR